MLEVREPATGELLGSLPEASEQDVRDAAARAAEPQSLWALVPAQARARMVRRAAQLVLDESDALAERLAREAGLPRTEGMLAELLPSVRGLHGLAEDGPRALAGRRPWRPSLRRATVVQAPAGVAGIAPPRASPWSEPLLEVAAALLAGNGVVLAPAAPLAAEEMRALLVRAGIPPELLQVVHGEAAAAALPEACDTVAGVAPAPGPKAAMVVLSGAPLERAVGGALWAAFAGAGQSPGAAGRLIVQRDRAADLLAGLEAGARALRLGDPRLSGTEVGPLRTAAQATAVGELIEDAVERGATLVCGGPAPLDGLAGAWIAPAVLRGVPSGARLLREPVPGPVLAVVEAADEAEAVALARETPGAAVSVWSGDRRHGERVARAIGTEVAWVNQHGFSAPSAAVRLARHVEVRQIASRPLALRSASRLPYDPGLVAASVTAARVRHGRESDRVATLRTGAGPLVRAAVRLARRR